MAKDRISALYEKHKVHPRGRNSEDHPAPYHPARYDHSPKDGALRRNDPQDIEDSHDNHRGRYDNIVDERSWLRNGDATSKPSFDKSNAWRTDRDTGMRDQIKVRSADFRRHHTEFERHNANGSVTHDPMKHDFSKRHITEAEKRNEFGIYDSDHPKHTGPWLKGKQ
jgi:hypothetical protein